MIPTNMTFTRGERLTAQKMNQLATMASGQYSRTVPRPGGNMGFSGDLSWGNAGIVCQQPPNKPRFKPFDIQSCYDVSGYLTSYVIQRPFWYDGATEMSLSDDVLITRTNEETGEAKKDEVSAISCIYLCHCSAYGGNAEDQEPPSLGSDEEWVVIDNITKDKDFPKESEDDPEVSISVVGEWKLFEVSTGLITHDIRDAFVQVGGEEKSEPTSSEVLLDLSSLNWFQQEVSVEVSVEVSGETSVETSVGLSGDLSAQVWNYHTLSADDIVNMELRHYNEEMSEEQVSTCIDKYRFLARPEDGGTLKYVSLSVLSAIQVDMQSVNYKTIPESASSDTPKDINIIQSWNYEAPSSDDMADVEKLDQTTTYRFLARPEEGGTLKYVSLSGVVSGILSSVSGQVGFPDADVPASETKSIQTRLVSEDLSVIQLYEFDKMLTTTPVPTDHVVVRRTNKEVDYVPITELSGVLAPSITNIVNEIVAPLSGGEITLSGTDDSWSKGKEFVFVSASNSNVSVNIDAKKITVGVYYI